MNSAWNMNKICIFSYLFILLCVPAIHGQCLTDSDTGHSSADYNQRLFSYSSKQPIQPSTSSDLRFMTFNLQSGYLFNCVNNVTAQALEMMGMDYVGNQETVQGVDTRCNCNIPKMIADTTGMSTRFFMTLPYRTGQYGINIGTTQSILDIKSTLLAYTGVEQRAVFAVKTQPLALRGQYLWFVNTHVEYYNSDARQSQVAQIVTFVQSIIASDPTCVVVMTGDFNGGPWDAMYTTIKQAGMRNAWEEFHGSINDGNTHPADWPSVRMDHIWFYAPSVVSVTVKSAVVPDVRLSDHRPFTATLSFSQSGNVASVPTFTPTVVPTVTPSRAPTAAPTSGSGTVVCVGPLGEGQTLRLACPSSSQKITSIQFASYGTPTGTCGAFKVGNCIGGSSMAVAIDKCLNYNSCSFTVANNVFGDPCPYTAKHFDMQVLCN